MPELYPLLMAPHFDRRPWGARDLAPLYDRHVHPGEEPIGEVWLTWDQCRVANGPFGGATLGELCRRFGRDLVGVSARETERFPLLIKFLFPRDKLSVQVHPDDETAHRLGEPCGKTECWYVVHADPGAQVALGLKPGTRREEFERAIREQRAEQLLNWVDLEAGDMIYVDAGTVHTLGPGLIILETQQNSNTTYRLYDYGRPRELHVEQGLEAMKERTQAGKVKRSGGERLIESPCFIVERFVLDRYRDFVDNQRRSAEVLIAIDGCAVVETPDIGDVMFSRGEAVVVPAALARYRVRAQWNVEVIRAALP
ncbi:MAG: type I phosphomannose isomerase catalytic subunit [Terriglobales bacterium]